MKPQLLLLALGLGMVGSAGFLAAGALSQGSQEPTRTVTVNVGTGPQGPAGPPGPQGPQGPPGPSGDICGGAPTGFEPGVLVFNAPGGQVRIFTCLGP